MAPFVTLDEDVIAIRREADGDLPACGLTLWRSDEGYKLVDILAVEAQAGDLSSDVHNRVLDDFIATVVAPASQSGTLFSADVTSS